MTVQDLIESFEDLLQTLTVIADELARIRKALEFGFDKTPSHG